MTRARRVSLLSPLLAALLMSVACDSSTGPELEIEKLPEIKPSLPSVPTLPPPPYPVQYSDNSFSLFGLRKRIKTTMDTDVEVTGYVVETYTPPTCPKGTVCPPARAPHVYVADSKDERDANKRILLVGYAENQKAIDEAIQQKKRGKYKAPDPASGMIPVPYDLFPGAKIRVKARFNRVSSSGFAQSDGLLDYRGHVTLEAAPEPSKS